MSLGAWCLASWYARKRERTMGISDRITHDDAGGGGGQVPHVSSKAAQDQTNIPAILEAGSMETFKKPTLRSIPMSEVMLLHSRWQR